MPERLRIIEVINVRWFNATAWYGLSLSRLLREAGHEVLVLGLAGTDSFARAEAMGLDPLPLDLNTVNPARLPLLLRRMAGIRKNFAPHIVNCHRGEGLVFWGLLKAAGPPFALVRTRGDQRSPKGNAPNRGLHARLVDALIATNSRTAAQCRTLLGLPEDRVFTVLGGVDTRRFAPDPAARARVRAAYGAARTDRLVGLLGRFDPVKGQKELLEAMRRVLAGCGDAGPCGRVRIMLIGLPASLSEETIRGWIRDFGLQDRVTLVGRVEDVAAHINALDLGVIASQGSEAIARAAFEIMACGVPLVGTDVGVMPDLLAPHALAPAGDAPALAALLERALLDPAFCPQLRAEQRRRMATLTERDFLEQTLAVYRAAFARRIRG